MEKEFVPYELAIRLKKLGYNEKNMAFYFKRGSLNRFWNRIYKNDVCDIDRVHNFHCTAPLWQQAFDWFYNIHGLEGNVVTTHFGNETFGYNILEYCVKDPYKAKGNHYKTREEARQACLEKLITLI